MTRISLGIIDAQRGFMPASEGERLSLEGFGELPIDDAEKIISPINNLLGAIALTSRMPVFTTQDWHPSDTAHFSENPNFVDTWPVHCVKNTPGAELHPGLWLPNSNYTGTYTSSFKKGWEKLAPGEQDNSYSGYYAESLSHSRSGKFLKQSLPNWLQEKNIDEVWLTGIALSHCLGATALDLRNRMGLDVTIALDATRSVSPESHQKMLEKLDNAGVKMSTTNAMIEELNKSRIEYNVEQSNMRLSHPMIEGPVRVDIHGAILFDGELEN